MRYHLEQMGIRLNASSSKTLVKRLFYDMDAYLRDGSLPDYLTAEDSDKENRMRQ